VGPSDIAIVVPVFGDRTALYSLVERIRGWPDQPGELIVVSTEPDPALSDYCDDHDCRCVVSVRCRGAQLDTGARSADSEALWFLHADAAPNASSLGKVSQALTGGTEGGHFRFGFSGTPGWRKSILAALVNCRVRLGGIPYGDQGLFVHRRSYLECGGFPHQPLFEEVELVGRLRARGHFRCLDSTIGVSPRRWERDGWWRRSLGNRHLAIRYMLGATAEHLSVSYDQVPVADEKLTS